MRILVDEDVPRDVINHLTNKGHQVATVAQMGWGGVWEKRMHDGLQKIGHDYDRDLMHMYRGKAAGFDLFVTCDQRAIDRAKRKFDGADNFPLPTIRALSNNDKAKIPAQLGAFDDKINKFTQIQALNTKTPLTAEQWQAVNTSEKGPHRGPNGTPSLSSGSGSKPLSASKQWQGVGEENSTSKTEKHDSKTSERIRDAEQKRSVALKELKGQTASLGATPAVQPAPTQVETLKPSPTLTEGTGPKPKPSL